MGRNLTRLIIAAAVSVFVLALLLHLVGGAGDRAAQLLAVLRGASVPLLSAYAVCMLVQAAWRAMRYRLLLRAAGEPTVPGFGHMYLVTLARNMFVDLLPARVGELSYIAMLNRGYRVSGTACVSSLGISVLFDFAALLVIVTGLLAVELAVGNLPMWLIDVTSVLAIAVAVGLAAVFYAYEPMLRGVRGILARMPRVLVFLEKLAGAIRATRTAGVLGRTLGLSLLVRVFKYAGMYFAFLAVARAAFPEMASVAYWKVLLSLLSSEAAASAPVPTFMSFGSYESGGTAMWTLLGFPAADAALCTLALHICSQVMDYSVGGLGLLVFTLLVPGRASSSRPRLRALALAVALGLAVVAVAFLWFERRGAIKRGALEAPPPGQPIAASSVVPPSSLLPRGFLVWSSNRSGNHDIWKLALPDGAPEQVTKHPNTESYPRISPDGRRLSFSRAHLPWVSQRNHTAWDIYVRDLESGRETFVASNSIDAVWTGDGKCLVYVQGRTNVIRHNLETGEPLVVAAAGEGGVSGDALFTTPGFNDRTAEVSVTVRGSKRMTAVISADAGCREVSGGCQMYWSPDGAFLFNVDHHGGKKNAFFKIDPASGERSLWFDNPGEWSHEYFPKLSADGRWLVFGASAEGHEHDTSDYEIFLWEVDSDPATTTRLTWHTGNDCWPDIWIANR
jgi:uncharacterized membrane protein YbhN (UPF0104 family)